MNCRIAKGLPVVAAAALAALLATAPLSSAVFGQTLAEPAPAAKWSPPQPSAKPGAKRHPSVAAKKPCSAFGPGFVNAPGTDACVKIGGWVTVEGGAGR